MTPELELQHSRTLLLPELEVDQIERLQTSEVWVIGLGGLGTAASLYLASSGVGRLHLVDGDQIDASNLPRQILYGQADLGRPKAEVAAERLRSLNPNAQISAHTQMAQRDWLESVLQSASLVLDCTDRFVSRQSINEVCLRLQIPLVIASVVRWEGQLLACGPSLRAQGCYACTFPLVNDASGSSAVDAACGAFGVFPSMAGVMATLQAQEALKLLLGLRPEPDLLMLQGPSLELIRIQRRRDPNCPACKGA